MRAFGGASLKDHWKDFKSRSLLSESGWERLIIQPETFDPTLEGDHEQFSYAAKLLGAAGKAKSATVVSWTASEALSASGSEARRETFYAVETNHAGMALRTAAET